LIHFHKRVRTHALAAFAVPGVALAVAANEPIAAKAGPTEILVAFGGFIVVVLGALSLAFVRWLNKVEGNVPRDPDRTTQALASLAADLGSLRTEVGEVRSDVGDVRERLAHIEGRLDR
jgi:hypothetical protein